jgi:hypothetical protein
VQRLDEQVAAVGRRRERPQERRRRERLDAAIEVEQPERRGEHVLEHRLVVGARQQVLPGAAGRGAPRGLLDHRTRGHQRRLGRRSEVRRHDRRQEPRRVGQPRRRVERREVETHIGEAARGRRGDIEQPRLDAVLALERERHLRAVGRPPRVRDAQRLRDIRGRQTGDGALPRVGDAQQAQPGERGRAARRERAPAHAQPGEPQLWLGELGDARQRGHLEQQQPVALRARHRLRRGRGVDDGGERGRGALIGRLR